MISAAVLLITVLSFGGETAAPSAVSVSSKGESKVSAASKPMEKTCDPNSSATKILQRVKHKTGGGDPDPSADCVP
jgi:hypothetical protein